MGTLAIEMAGVLGVILSLVFVGHQLRQANNIARLQVLQEHAAQWRANNLAIASDPLLVGAFMSADNGATHEDLEPAERYVLDIAMQGLVHGWEANFKQLQLGVLKPDDIILPPASASAWWGSPYMKELWADTRSLHSEEFATFWEERFALRDGL